MTSSRTKRYTWLCLTPISSGPGSYRVEVPRLPSWWHRFWMRAILGWHYTQTENRND